jgi:outer membrane protein assembly factor BamB
LRGRKRLRVTVAALAVGVGAVTAVVAVHRTGRDVHGSATTEYIRTVPHLPIRPNLAWPQWGRDASRTRRAPGTLRPPFRLRWVFRGGSLLEFPPALAYGRLYLPTFAGQLVALDPSSGRVLWRYDSGRCAWASPAVASGLVFQTFLLRPPCRPDTHGRGELVALDARTGAMRWRAALPATESSPLVADGLVWIGDWAGHVSAFSARTGRLRWTFQADAAVKSSPALAGGQLYVATYGGRLYALDPWTGNELWHASVQPRLGGHGRFYSTPAVAHERVYLGSTDGKVYAYGARSGRLRWSFSTGGYVYGSPAVWNDLVLIGSYDHRFYALDAATGAVRWSFDAGGRISGSATVLGDVVYVSTLAERTFALAVRSGRRLWTFPDGKYSAGVADSARFYLVGYDRLFALTPRQPSRPTDVP